MLRRKLRNHPEYEMALVGAVAGEGASEELDLPLSADPVASAIILATKRSRGHRRRALSVTAHLNNRRTEATRECFSQEAITRATSRDVIA